MWFEFDSSDTPVDMGGSQESRGLNMPEFDLPFSSAFLSCKL